MPGLRVPDDPREVVDRGGEDAHRRRVQAPYYAHELEHMRASGLELAAPVEADYGIVRPGGALSDEDMEDEE